MTQNIQEKIANEIVAQLHVYKSLASGTVMFLEGPWGTGKSHILEKIVSPKLDYYFRVSLFGINSIEQLEKAFNRACLLGAFKLKKEHKAVKFATGLGSAITKVIKKAGVDLEEVLALDFIDSIDNNYVVAFDDFERKGTSLEVQQIFGFVSKLSEVNGVRVIVVCASNHLDGDKDVYTKLKERLSHKTIVLENTSEALKKLVDKYGIEKRPTLKKSIKNASRFLFVKTLNLRAAIAYLDALSRIDAIIKKSLCEEHLYFLWTLIVETSEGRELLDTNQFEFGPSTLVFLKDRTDERAVRAVNYFKKYYGEDQKFESLPALIGFARTGMLDEISLKSELRPSSKSALDKAVATARSGQLILKDEDEISSLIEALKHGLDGNKFGPNWVNVCINLISVCFWHLGQELPAEVVSSAVVGLETAMSKFETFSDLRTVDDLDFYGNLPWFRGAYAIEKKKAVRRILLKTVDGAVRTKNMAELTGLLDSRPELFNEYSGDIANLISEIVGTDDKRMYLVLDRVAARFKLGGFDNLGPYLELVRSISVTGKDLLAKKRKMLLETSFAGIPGVDKADGGSS